MSENKVWATLIACAATVLIAVAVGMSMYYIQAESAHRPYSTTVDGKTVVCAWSSDIKARTEGWTCK